MKGVKILPVTLKFEYSAKVNKGLKNRVKKEIINAAESSKEMIKEIRRVCQQANRRAQNVEKAGLLSPAVVSLGKSGVYSKFNITGMSWEQAKREYGRAVAFLNQPTSSATGARDFERQSRAALNCDNDVWNMIKQDFTRGFSGAIDGILAKIPYAELMQEIYERAEIQANSQMEIDAITAAENLQNSINSAAENIAGNIEDYFTGFEM